MHPYINKLIAEEREAGWRAEAASYRLAREAKARKRKSGESHAARQQAPGQQAPGQPVPAQPVPAQPGGRSPSQPVVGRSSREYVDRLVSAGRTRSDQGKWN